MSAPFPRLLGDIGGTNARWGWQGSPGAPIAAIDVAPVASHASLLDAARDYLARHGHLPPRAAAIGIATPVTGDAVRMTNHPWAFSIRALQASLGVERLRVLNDFEALALALPALDASGLLALGHGADARAADAAPRALLGAGTGLGASALLRCGGRWHAVAGEGGHVTLAAADDDEAALIARLRRAHGHVSAERVCSGAGLVVLYRAACELDGRAPRTLTPAEVGQFALDASDADCVRAVGWFAGFLGNVAGNLALTLGTRGGVYVGGGVVPRLGAAFDVARFRARFEAKGRFADYLRPIPTWLVVAATPALTGAARALDDEADDGAGIDARAGATIR
jgi:glucokinase